LCLAVIGIELVFYLWVEVYNLLKLHSLSQELAILEYLLVDGLILGERFL
jgi:hypothetical protein